MKKFIFKIALLAILFVSSLAPVWSQPPPPPGGHGLSNDQVPGGGAPVGSGTLLLIGMAALYGGSKVYTKRSTSEDEE